MLVTLQELAAFRGDFACGCLRRGHRFTPRGGAKRKTGRLTVLLKGRHLLAAIKAHRPASFAFHLLRRHISDRLFDPWPQVRTLLARKLLSTGGGEAALRVFWPAPSSFRLGASGALLFSRVHVVDEVGIFATCLLGRPLGGGLALRRQFGVAALFRRRLFPRFFGG
jgi:hypothetical protein